MKEPQKTLMYPNPGIPPVGYVTNCANVKDAPIVNRRCNLLVLTRRRGESIQIGSDITIRVLDVKGGQIRLGIEAPKDSNIVRTELLPEQAQPRNVRG